MYYNTETKTFCTLDELKAQYRNDVINGFINGVFRYIPDSINVDVNKRADIEIR